MFISYLSVLVTVVFGLIPSSNGKMDAAAEFRYADANSDGYISAAEFRTYMMDEGLTDDQINAKFAEIDTNRDGRINRTENAAIFQRWEEEYKQGLQEWFQSADTNRDGRLSLNEVLTRSLADGDTESDTTVVFNAVDTNTDRMLSKDEFMSYDWGDEEDE
uniref:EF-hand domain-containing protein n=1 Tax=Plectus sambesii TaxID=2011161 RepID=A0A914V2Y1_9BILA